MLFRSSSFPGRSRQAVRERPGNELQGHQRQRDRERRFDFPARGGVRVEVQDRAPAPFYSNAEQARNRALRKIEKSKG